MKSKPAFVLAFLTFLPGSFLAAQEDNATAAEPEEARWSSFLPLNKELAEGRDLPLPFGIGVTGYWQEQGMKANSIGFDLDPSGLNPLLTTISATATATNVESELDNYNARVDAWILPFLNVYGVYGEVDGENTASGLALDAVTTATLTGLGVTLPSSFTFSYDGDVYGFGLILAGEWGRVWGTLDYNFTQADLDISTSEIDTSTLTPRLGVRGNLGGVQGSLWLGAMYQDIDERQVGNLLFPATVGAATVNLPVAYDVRLQQDEQWNFLVGAGAELSEQWNLSLEGGFGDREQFMGNLTFRF